MQLAREWEEQEQYRVENQRQPPETMPTPLHKLLPHFSSRELLNELRRRGHVIHVLGEDHENNRSY
jgi:hypothetical protein